MFFGLVLLAIGVVALLIQMGIISGSVWSYFWPIVLIALGLSFIIGRFTRQGHRMWCGSWWSPHGGKNHDEEKHGGSETKS